METPEKTGPLRCSLAARLREVLTSDPVAKKEAIFSFDIMQRMLEHKIERSHPRGHFSADMRVGAGVYIWAMKQVAQRPDGQHSQEALTTQVLETLREAKISPHHFGQILQKIDGADPLTTTHFMREAKRRDATQVSLRPLRHVQGWQASGLAETAAPAVPVQLPRAA